MGVRRGRPSNAGLSLGFEKLPGRDDDAPAALTLPPRCFRHGQFPGSQARPRRRAFSNGHGIGRIGRAQRCARGADAMIGARGHESTRSTQDFKTSRAVQPTAWKVRFLRRLVERTAASPAREGRSGLVVRDGSKCRQLAAPPNGTIAQTIARIADSERVFESSGRGTIARDALRHGYRDSPL
jgi:hypothetical protein